LGKFKDKNKTFCGHYLFCQKLATAGQNSIENAQRLLKNLLQTDRQIFCALSVMQQVI